MTKAYSNKALPPGTVLREWRLEEVLGVGGFGIVYKARGIYFDELVAIKEYFPSSISERDSDDTVVPIDSDAEEVHALGLKKFVEEAKLLWNLSTPSRHPNIVSVRSLFEIHGTAYMVMDFEDGVSLSRMLKQGRRFNERSLWNILCPIAKGLERAHRIGVLHRDIKPPNILINEENRPVLIDFGSARFEAAEATSTKVTFHTPPYAAIEQYVKTYDQGPWTDIYALGVVMNECVTGEKPPEVLERLHAGLGKPLAGGKWPGYSKRFLAAIDAAMIVKPDERPQSIGEWLKLFGKPLNTETDQSEDDEATLFFAGQVEAEDIVPVPPTPTPAKEPVETGVPRDPKKAKFKRAGEETSVSRKVKSEDEAAEEAGNTPGKVVAASAAAEDAAASPESGTMEKRGESAREKKPNIALMAGAAAAVLAIIAVGALTLPGSRSEPEAGASPLVAPASDESEATVAALGPPEAGLANASAEAATNAAGPAIAEAASDQAALDALRSERARAAAAEAELSALKKSAASAAPSRATSGAQPTTSQRPDSRSNTAAQSGADSGVSPAKLAQFYAIVDDARSTARRVMRRGSRENAALARTYDSNLKTLRDSMRGIRSDREADRLISQANQTRAYVQFLARQE